MREREDPFFGADGDVAKIAAVPECLAKFICREAVWLSELNTSKVFLGGYCRGVVFHTCNEEGIVVVEHCAGFIVDLFVDEENLEAFRAISFMFLVSFLVFPQTEVQHL